MAGSKPKNKLVETKGKKVGRPSAIDEKKMIKLIDAFKQGALIDTAVNYAGVARRTFFDYMEKNVDFRTRINEARSFSRLVAGNVVMQAIVKDKDVGTAKWWLEKKYRHEFGENPQTLIQQNFNNVDNKEVDNADLERFAGAVPEEVSALDDTSAAG